MTHWVARPVTRTSASGTRIVCQSFEMRITDPFFFCSSVRVNAPITCPVFSVIAPTFTPLQPRHCSRYSASPEIFPIPFSVTVKTYVSSFHATQPSISESPLATFIPRTHAAARPMTRTSVSGNWIAFPPRETISTLSVPSVTRTQRRESPS